MIAPAGTSWPSPALTPRRWPTLSRPFLTLPPAFLWAMGSYSSFFVARFGARFFGAASASASSASAAFALVVVFFGAPLALDLADVAVPALADVLVSALSSSSSFLSAALAIAFVADALVDAFGAASLAASSASLAACTAAASSRRWRSVLASASALAADFAALLPLSVMSLMRRTVSSWR